MKTANIYFDGRIYEGVPEGESRYNYPSYPVSGIHNFKNGQEVTGLYELGPNEDFIHSAIPIPNNEAGEKEERTPAEWLREFEMLRNVMPNEKAMKELKQMIITEYEKNYC